MDHSARPCSGSGDRLGTPVSRLRGRPGGSGRLGPARYRATRGVEPARQGWVRKHVDGAPRDEVAKAKAMRRILSSGPHVAPAARVGDLPATILLEDLGALTSVTELAESGDHDRLISAAENAGRILARLHRGLTEEFGTRDTTDAPRPFRGRVVLHGDYAPTNVFVDERGRTVTLDGSASYVVSTSPFTTGRVEADLTSFTANLCWPFRLLHWRRQQRRNRVAARRAFLDAYRSETGWRPNRYPVFEAIAIVQSLWFRKVRPRR